MASPGRGAWMLSLDQEGVVLFLLQSPLCLSPSLRQRVRLSLQSTPPCEWTRLHLICLSLSFYLTLCAPVILSPYSFPIIRECLPLPPLQGRRQVELSHLVEGRRARCPLDFRSPLPEQAGNVVRA